MSSCFMHLGGDGRGGVFKTTTTNAGLALNHFPSKLKVTDKLS